MDNKENVQDDVVVVETPPVEVGSSAKGQYKYEIRDEDGVVYDSGDWKPNLILDCGLDKLADMPWAQTFQWSVVGTDPTPTVDKYEDTHLRVTIEQSYDCKNLDPDFQDLRCHEVAPPILLAKATAGCREAPLLPEWYDPVQKKMVPQVPEVAVDEARSFGKFTDVGKTLYLRDRNLQFKVLSSCPEYSVEPIQIELQAVPVSGSCSGLSAMDTDVDDTLHMIEDGGAPFAIDSQLRGISSAVLGQGYLSGDGIGVTIPMGNPKVALLDGTGVQDPRSGISVSAPTGRSASGKVSVNGNPCHTGIVQTDIAVTDGGDGYGFVDCGGSIQVTFQPPAYDAHHGPFNWHWRTWNNSANAGTAGERQSYGLAGCSYYSLQNYSNQPRIYDTMISANFERVFGSSHVSGAKDEKKAFGSFGTAYTNVSGYNDANMNVCAAQLLFMNLLEWGDAASGNDRGDATTGLYTSGPNTAPLGSINLNSYQYQPTGWTDSHNGPLPARGKTWKTLVDELGTNVTGGGVTLKTATDATLAETQIAHAHSYYYAHHSYGPSTNTSPVSPLDPVNNFYVWRYSDGLMTASVPNIHKYHEAVARSSTTQAAGQLDFQGKNLDTVMENIASDPAAFVDEIENQNGISQIDLEKIVDAMDDEPVDFYLPVCGASSSLKNWQFGYPTQSTVASIIKGGQLLRGVASIGQGDPDTSYAVPLQTSSTTIMDHYAYGSYKFGDTDAANLLNAINTAQQTQQGWHHNGSWNIEDGPGPKGLFCGDGEGISNNNTSVELLTDSAGNLAVVRIHPKELFKKLLTNCRNGGGDYNNWNSNIKQCVAAYGTDSDTRQIWRAHTIPYRIKHSTDNFLGLPGRQAAKGEVVAKNCMVHEVNLTEPGLGYRVGDKPWIKFSAPVTRPAEIEVTTNDIGTIVDIDVIDPGAGYSCLKPAVFTFPEPPPQRVRAYNLQLKPVNTYENINNNYFFKTGDADDGTPALLGVADLDNERCDVYNTEQTYLGQGKSHFDQGQRTTWDQGGYENAPDRYGPCHFVDHGLNVGGQEVTHNQYKTHGWYVTGVEHETNSQYCGTAFLSAANQMSLVRTFDYYMELQPVTYTEIGFKESPAARELFSRIVFDDPIRLRAGQYLRIAYQLLVTMEPGASGRYKEVPAEGTWYNGERTWYDHNIDPADDGHETHQNVLSGYECIQHNGMCVVDERGLAVPYDISGVANEPYSPGSYLLGPQYGYVNRWKNGDTRLSFPTREYKNDENNPWILGGDQMNPPDYAIKYFDSPTANYRPRDFKSYLEWPSYETSIPYYSNTSSSTLNWLSLKMPAGPESTLERDAFAHWFTPTFPNKSGSITWTNFVNNAAGGGNVNTGRWDYHTTKAYVREVYPQLVREPHVYGITVNDAWYNKYRKGDLLNQTSMAEHRSGKGVYMEPVIEYDGGPGGLHDPTTVSTVRKNPLSHLGGMGAISRATYRVHNMYTGKKIYMVKPHNNLYTGVGLATGSPALGNLSMNCGAGPYSWGSTNANTWCYPTGHDPITDDGVFGPHGLIQRKNDLRMTSLRTNTYLTTEYGGGFTTLDSWKPWTHTPHIDAKVGTIPSAINPDTSGNWSAAEAIPVAGSSAWISTNRDDFEECGLSKNRGHTLFGAVCGHMPAVIEQFYRDSDNADIAEHPDYAKADTSWSFACEPNKVFHDFSARVSDLLRYTDNGAGAAGQVGPKLRAQFNIDEKQLVTQEYTGVSSRSFETPTYLNDYKRGDHKRFKYAEWETSFGNLTAVSSIGLGPTSTSLRPNDMTDASRFNSYVFKFGDFNVDPSDDVDQAVASGIPFGEPGANSFNNLSTYKLKATFQFTWYRDLT